MSELTTLDITIKCLGKCIFFIISALFTIDEDPDPKQVIKNVKGNSPDDKYTQKFSRLGSLTMVNTI